MCPWIKEQNANNYTASITVNKQPKCILGTGTKRVGVGIMNRNYETAKLRWWIMQRYCAVEKGKH